jgi:hypothetical protein
VAEVPKNLPHPNKRRWNKNDQKNSTGENREDGYRRNREMEEIPVMHHDDINSHNLRRPTILKYMKKGGHIPGI